MYADVLVLGTLSALISDSFFSGLSFWQRTAMNTAILLTPYWASKTVGNLICLNENSLQNIFICQMEKEFFSAFLAAGILVVVQSYIRMQTMLQENVSNDSH